MDIEKAEEREEFSLFRILGDLMEITRTSDDAGKTTLYGKFLIPEKDAIPILQKRLAEQNMVPHLRREGNEVSIQIGRKVELPPANPLINLLLFLATVITTLFAGALQRGANPLTDPGSIVLGVPFSFTLLTILGAHELGHYFASRRLGINATLPYFLPFPHIIGTFGAVIKIRSPMPDRRALVEVGAAGPFAGMIFAIPAVVIGLKLSEIIEISELAGGISLGNSFLFWLFSRLSIGSIAEGYDVVLHPVAFAGWIGFFVTAMNLLPMGQLDGGHISYALFGKRHRPLALAFFVLLLLFGLRWTGWLFFGMLVMIIGLRHPPPLDDLTVLSPVHKFTSWIAFILFVLTFTPVPFGFQ
jgi:membrane-associated protease RseP (regulator of RpoE activity)